MSENDNEFVQNKLDLLCQGSDEMGPVFVDFEASSLSQRSWPIEVGLSWLEGRRVIVESKLIRPRSEWPEDDWSAKSEAVHGIPRCDLNHAEAADDVVSWLRNVVRGRVLASDAPEFDQRWLNRLLGNSTGGNIRDFDQLAWWAFSDEGVLNPGKLHRVYRAMTKQRTAHRAGPDAQNLCYAWRAGIGK